MLHYISPIALVYAKFSFLQQLAILPLHAILAQLLDFHCLCNLYTHISTVNKWDSCQQIFMDLKRISCEVECKCTVIHSVYKTPGTFTFATLI